MTEWLEQPNLPENAMPLDAVIVTRYVDNDDGQTYTMVSVRGISDETTVLGLLTKGILKIGLHADVDTGRKHE